MRRPTIAERAEDLARFLTQRTKSKLWCKCIIVDKIDIRYQPTDPIALIYGSEYERGYKAVGLHPGSDFVYRLGLFPYAPINTPEWEEEARQLNEAIRLVIARRQSHYGKKRPRTVKSGMRNGKRVKRKR